MMSLTVRSVHQHWSLPGLLMWRKFGFFSVSFYLSLLFSSFVSDVSFSLHPPYCRLLQDKKGLQRYNHHKKDRPQIPLARVHRQLQEYRSAGKDYIFLYIQKRDTGRPRVTFIQKRLAFLHFLLILLPLGLLLLFGQTIGSLFI
ncbi:hypothetical protein EJ08DRAFT_94199 [Tothia fuscella]|uniref:Uncharacterized protein n=1 Tax=Tothia fuscella TaxID=1048955 RepID=A0A9P4NY23_9PEZI|nr:hypothetical protein EJ08DRAFT_94199 [Tothia fuscella]